MSATEVSEPYPWSGSYRIALCATCHREHPQGMRHCDICGRPSAFINDNGRCLSPACREAKK